MATTVLMSTMVVQRNKKYRKVPCIFGCPCMQYREHVHKKGFSTNMPACTRKIFSFKMFMVMLCRDAPLYIHNKYIAIYSLILAVIYLPVSATVYKIL